MLKFTKMNLVRIGRLLGNRSGSVLLYTALSAPVLLGFGGLAVDVAFWNIEKRAVQAVADSAASAGALGTLRSGGGSQVALAAERDAIANGYRSSAGHMLEVHYPPVSGARAGAGDAVEVVASRPLPLFLAQLFFSQAPTVTARAVATAGLNNACVWALHPDAKSALKVAGGANVSLNCGVVVNSVDLDALTQNGTTSCLTAESIKVSGNYTGNCVAPTPLVQVPPVEDPLAALQPPAHGGCDVTSNTTVNGGENVTLSPGVYCGNIKAVSTGHITFEPGLYVLDGAGLDIGAQATASGDGVSFYLTANSGASNNITIAAGATVSFVAATGGQLPGILFFHDRNSPGNVTHSLTGGSTMAIEGIIYLPNQNISYSGGTEFNAAASILIAQTITFTGQSNLGSFEGTAATANTTLIAARLVE